MTETKSAGPPTIDMARLDDQQLKKRIELNRDAQFGLQQATKDQLNIIFVLCRRWQLDPVTDITLYQGHPWVTLDGWCRVIRRHPEWTTLKQYPLKKEDKLDWGYAETDLVVATVLGTKSHGEITGYGKVTREEIVAAQDQAKNNNKRAAPVGLHPVEMASKRSLARAAKIALGLDIPDEQVIEGEVAEALAERNDPEKQKRDSDTYDRIYGKEYDDRVQVVPQPPQLPQPTRAVRPKPDREAERRSVAWQHNRALSVDALAAGFEAPTLRSDASVEEIEDANRALEDLLSAQDDNDQETES